MQKRRRMVASLRLREETAEHSELERVADFQFMESGKDQRGSKRGEIGFGLRGVNVGMVAGDKKATVGVKEHVGSRRTFGSIQVDEIGKDAIAEDLLGASFHVRPMNAGLRRWLGARLGLARTGNRGEELASLGGREPV
jgi:hypothetical protein